MSQKPVLGLIGAGKVGQVLMRLLYKADYRIGAIYSRTPPTALAGQVQAIIASDPRDVAAHTDLVVIAVPDDVIAGVVARVSGVVLDGKGVVHTSGAHGADQLSVLAENGAMTGSLHPAYPFASVEKALTELPGSTFAIEAENNLLAVWLGDIVRALNGSILSIPPGSKALYHAAMTIASNYTVTLYALAQQLLLTLSDEHEAVDGALNTLTAATMANLRTQGIPDALTGPLVRGDVSTVAAHLAALEQYDQHAADLYRQLARQTLPIVRARGVTTDELENLLGRS